MTSIRSARVLATAAASPAAVTPLGGVAQADNGGFGDGGANVSVPSVAGSGIGGGNFGEAATTPRVATGLGAGSRSDTAGVVGTGFSVIDQDNGRANFSPQW